MTTWDRICIKFKFRKARIVSRFVNSVRRKYINEEEKRLTPIAFFRKNHDEKEISVHCIDRYIATMNRQHKKIWSKGDHTFRYAHDKKALARGDVFVKNVENICYDKENMQKLFLVPDLIGTHCNIKPRVEDFHQEDVRLSKLADCSHLVKREN